MAEGTYREKLKGSSHECHPHPQELDSENLYLPELRTLVGKTVEIIVLEELSGVVVTPGTAEFQAFPVLAARIREEYDFDAPRQQREFDLLHANDLLP